MLRVPELKKKVVIGKERKNTYKKDTWEKNQYRFTINQQEMGGEGEGRLTGELFK